MKHFLTQLENIPASHTALNSGTHAVSYAELREKIDQVSTWLHTTQVSSVALYAQNSVEWILVDLACQTQGILLTPIPVFFSEEQFNGVLNAVKPDLILSDTPLPMAQSRCLCPALSLLCSFPEPSLPVNKPPGTVKITYTSGSTGAPKGVCLTQENQWRVTRSLVEVIGIEHPKHLCLLPLPVLLENIAGVYAPLLAGGEVVVLSDAERGFKGSALQAPANLPECISKYQPNTLICVPELLLVLVQACSGGWQPPESLQFIAAGGSKISPLLLQQASAMGLPVYQGYGLSECASVVSLNTSATDQHSCGSVLPHLSAELVNSQIIVRGNTFAGYLEDPGSWGMQSVATGDTGEFINGKLHITGRIKNTLITSYARNISPEWIEAELMATGAFYQAVVIGDRRPFCSAILCPVNPGTPTEQLLLVIEKVNASLPDYARIHHPLLLSSPMTAQQGLYTDNMRPKRQQIMNFYATQIEELYSRHT